MFTLTITHSDKTDIVSFIINIMIRCFKPDIEWIY